MVAGANLTANSDPGLFVANELSGDRSLIRSVVVVGGGDLPLQPTDHTAFRTASSGSPSVLRYSCHRLHHPSLVKVDRLKALFKHMNWIKGLAPLWISYLGFSTCAHLQLCELVQELNA